MNRILLFDMDNVLVTPRGYHLALSETVTRISRLLGFTPLHLTPEQVTRFEACGATSEWDSSAICAALLLAEAWKRDPDAALPAGPPLFDPADAGHGRVDLDHFLDLLAAQTETARPLQRAEGLILAQNPFVTGRQRAVVHDILTHARDIERSLTHRLFQELVLGSDLFARTYGLTPALSVQTGYLVAHDRPGVGPREQRALERWLAREGNSAAVFTNRPCLAPDGSGGTPEAEQGTRVVNLPGLPIVGLGGLRWLAASRGLSDPEAFLKPSPVHALAALRAACGEPLTAALAAAATLVETDAAALSPAATPVETDAAALSPAATPVETDAPAPGWSALDGATAWVFEDSDWGLKSATDAANLLARHGVRLSLHLCGVAPQPAKQTRLQAAGARVFDDLPLALRTVDGI